jgi:hypothetical protein
VKISFCVFLRLYAYSEKTGKVLKYIWRIGEIRVFWGTQNSLRLRGKKLCVHGEDAKRHKTVFISVDNNQNFIFFRFFLSTLYLMD